MASIIWRQTQAAVGWAAIHSGPYWAALDEATSPADGEARLRRLVFDDTPLAWVAIWHAPTEAPEGSAKDAQGAMKLVEESAAASRAEVEVVIADTAYGSGQTRREFADAGVPLVARTPHLPERGYFSPFRD